MDKIDSPRLLDEVERLRAALARATEAVNMIGRTDYAANGDRVCAFCGYSRHGEGCLRDAVLSDPDGASALAEWRAMEAVCQEAQKNCYHDCPECKMCAALAALDRARDAKNE